MFLRSREHPVDTGRSRGPLWIRPLQFSSTKRLRIHRTRSPDHETSALFDSPTRCMQIDPRQTFISQTAIVFTRMTQRIPVLLRALRHYDHAVPSPFAMYRLHVNLAHQHCFDMHLRKTRVTKSRLLPPDLYVWRQHCGSMLTCS